ncbi:MAG: plasmid recombination protein [Firmicutes bacterium]|jgi:uncharacterized coiled-coil protein SlyX|nr:plasmid recombination protein [Bacillota bacterium]
MEELSYSLHLSNDKNKTKRARQFAKSSKLSTTSLSNNAIQTHQQLSKVDKHNLRKYDNDKDLICIIRGTSSVVEDTKNLYLELFEDARIKYNEKQKRNDRKIENYFNHISNDNKRDLACEIIIELGDMDFWADKNDDFKHKMVDVYKEQILDLENIVSNFKIANATIHFDESSPHLHIVGVPFKEGSKNGMVVQVGKSDVFTTDSLRNIQDKMREYCISTFNKVYDLNYSLKIKEEGRNQDINVKNMINYRELKKEQEKNKKRLNELNDKADDLQNKSLQITNIIDNLKPNKLNKNNYSITNDEINEIKDYIKQTQDTTSNLKTTNDLTTILEHYEDDLKNHSKEVKNLQQRIKNRDNKINELEYKLDFANDTIDELEDKVSKLEEMLEYFKNLWKRFIEFLQNKFFSTDKYDNIIQDLYNEDILDNDDIDVIQNNKSKNEEIER